MSDIRNLHIPIDELRKKKGKAPAEEWTQRLTRDRHGNPRAELANAITALELHPEMAGVLAFDTFALRAVRLKRSPCSEAAGPWTPQDDLEATRWLQQQAGIHVGLDIVGQAVQYVSNKRPFHPVRDYLERLTWDGGRRIDTWLTDFVGAEPSEFVAAVSARWLISAVARIMRPGCKVDTCLILEGPQGRGKSRALKALAGDWFTDTVPDLRSKDAALQLSGVWIIELAELDSLGRAEAATAKAFLSRTTDRYRPPYGKRAEDAPRQCVFAGTVNHSDYLKDDTGGRRFWPIACGERIDVEALASTRDQLFAEAFARYRDGSPWWLDRPDLEEAAQEEQAARLVDDPWLAELEPWLRLKAAVTSEEVLRELGKPKSEMTKYDQQRVGAILRGLGWERKRFSKSKGGGWFYEKGEE